MGEMTAAKILSRPVSLYSSSRMGTFTKWSAEERETIRLLAEANTDIAKVADTLGRRESSIAWKAKEIGIKLPASWRKTIAPARKPRQPVWTPMAYPFINFRRAETETLLAVNALVPANLPGREDVCQEIMLAVLERGIPLSRSAVSEHIRRFYSANFEFHGRAFSLDAEMRGTDGFRLIDTLSTEDSIWHHI